MRKIPPMLAILIVVVIPVLGFLKVFPGASAHPFLPAVGLAVVGLVLLLLGGLGEWPSSRLWDVFKRFVEKCAEALILTAFIVVLFEFQHFREFYERSLRTVLTDTAFVRELSTTRQADLVRASIRARIGDSGDPTAVRAFAQHVFGELNDNQYVINEVRYLEKEWTSNVRMRAKNNLTRDIYVFADSEDHKLDDAIHGDAFLYDVVVDHVACFQINNEQKKVENHDLCKVEVTNRPTATRIVVHIPLKRGNHRVERFIERTIPPDLGPSTVVLDYFTKSFTINYHYPRDMTLEFRGFGNLRNRVEALNPVTRTLGPVNVFSHTFSGDDDDEWLSKGSSLEILFQPRKERTAPNPVP